MYFVVVIVIIIVMFIHNYSLLIVRDIFFTVCPLYSIMPLSKSAKRTEVNR